MYAKVGSNETAKTNPTIKGTITNQKTVEQEWNEIQNISNVKIYQHKTQTQERLIVEETYKRSGIYQVIARYKQE